MENFEIKPAFFTKNALLILFFFLLPVVVAGLLLNFQLEELKVCATCDLSPIIIVRTTFIGISVGLIAFLFSLRNRKIRVENNLVFFMKKPLFGRWTIDALIDFSRVDVVKERMEKRFIGKTAMVFHWLIFVMENKSKQELLLNGYDYAGIEKLFYYLRGKYPSVRFDTAIFRDSSEKLAGLHTGR